jgi:hypothetical protein
VAANVLGSARVSRVGFGVTPKQVPLHQQHKKSSRWRDAIARHARTRALPKNARLW